MTQEDSDRAKKKVVLQLKGKWREHRNLQIYNKVEFIFAIQTILLVCMLYTIDAYTVLELQDEAGGE